MGNEGIIDISKPLTPQGARKDTQKNRSDGWVNLYSGMGTTKDKSTHTTFKASSLIPFDTLSAIYMGDGLAASIIDMFADDLTREWGKIENDPIGKDGVGVIAKEMQTLDVMTAYNTAEKWSRLSGGALIIIGVLDGSPPDRPLNIEKIKSIEYLKVVDINDIDYSKCKFNKDPKSSEYGKMELYAIRYYIGSELITKTVHSSRCIPFFGKKVPGRRLVNQEARYWGISELQGIMPYLRQYEEAIGAVSSVLNEFIIGKFKFSDLDEMLAEDDGKRAKARIEAIEMGKSTINAVLMGTDEDYTRDTVSLSGIPDTLDRYMMNLAAVSRYPVTKLFGRSPAGLNSTGENDTKNYYDSVRARQNAEWPYIQMLVNMIASMKKIKKYTPFVWNSLSQLNEKEEADVERTEAETYRTKADADDRYLTQGVLLPEEVYKLRFEKELGPKDPSEFEIPEPEMNIPLVSGVQPEGMPPPQKFTVKPPVQGKK